MRRFAGWAAAALAGIVFGSLPATASTGADWLASQSQADGSFSGSADISTPFQATAEVLSAFSLLGLPDHPARPAALAYLDSEPFSGTENLARRIVAHAADAGVVSALLAQLVSRQNADGSFGELPGHPGTVLDTALALEALALGASTNAGKVSAAVGYLIRQQRADGGWNIVDSASDNYTTALAIRALHAHRSASTEIAPAISKSAAYLFSERDANGLWPEVFESALALASLSTVQSDVGALRQSAQALEGLQRADGSWAGDVYATALALRALALFDARKAGAPSSGTSGTIAGYVRRAGTGEPLAGATVALASRTGVATTSNGAGYFVLVGIPAGEQTIVTSKVGYSAASAVATVRSGNIAYVADVHLQQTSGTGLIEGRVFDAVSRQGLAGATVTLAAPASTTATTAGDGSFQFGTLAPGRYGFSVSAPGYSSASGTLDVADGNTVHLWQGLAAEGAAADPEAGAVRGRVVSGTTGEPMRGITLTLSGGASTTSGADGAFAFSAVASGSQRIDLAAPGFEPRTYGWTQDERVPADLGDLRIFPLDGSQAPSSLTLRGRAVSGLTNEPVAGAAVLRQDGATWTTDADGRFTIDGAPALAFALEISAAGHETRSYDVAAAGYGEMAQTFVLPLAGGDDSATSTTVRGVIRDAESGTGIGGARVALSGTALSAAADAGGVFVLNGIPSLDFTLVFSGAGYDARTLHAQTARRGTYDIAIDLQARPADDGEAFQIASFYPLQTGGGANAVHAFFAQVVNRSTAARTVVLVGEVLDGSDAVVGAVTTYLPGAESPAGQIEFQPDQQQDVVVRWNAAQVAPGPYRLILRVVEAGTPSRELPRGIVLAEAETLAQVVTTPAFAGELAFDPPLVQAGTNQPVTLSAVLLNSGNVPLLGTGFTLSVQDPSDGRVLQSMQAQAEALDVGRHAIVGFGSWLPPRAGEFPVSVRSDGADVAGLVTGTLYVGDKATAQFSVDRAIVPLGTQSVRGTVALRGVDVSTATSTDPLFFPVKEAVRKGGEYVAQNAPPWYETNQCLGCHVQTQSFLGLARAREKVAVDTAALQFLHNNLAGSQHDDGSIRLSHFQHAKVQTSLALWSLSEWSDGARIVRTLYRAAEFMFNRKHTNNNDETWWETDDCSGWWCEPPALNMATVRGMSAVLRHAETLGSDAPIDYRLESDMDLGVPNVMRMVDGPDGWLWYLDYDGNLYAKNPTSLASRTVATGLPRPSYGLVVTADGTAFVSSKGAVTRISPQGAKSAIFTATDHYLTDVALGADDMLYVADYLHHRILRISQAGDATVLASGAPLNQPHSLAFDDSGNLLVTNYSGRNILKVANGEVSVFSAGIPYGPIYIKRIPGGDFLVSAWSIEGNDIGLYRLNAEGFGTRIFNLEPTNVGAVSLGVVGGTAYLRGVADNRLRRLVQTPIDATRLAEFRNTVARVARYEANRYRDGITYDNNLILAWRLITLSEAQPHIGDPALTSRITAAIDDIASVLRSRQRSDGGWGRRTYMDSDSLVTAAVGLALEYTNPSIDDPLVRNSIAFLLGRQQGDKSWPNENRVFTTNLAATSFVMAYLPIALERLGGIDVDLSIVTPANVALRNPSVTPTAQTPEPDGGVRHQWHLPTVTATERDVAFDLALQDMANGEERAVAVEAYLEFPNSFTEQALRDDIAVPKVKAVSDLGLMLATDRPSYSADSPVAISGRVGNVGPSVTGGQVHVYVRTSDGATVLADLGTVAYAELATGAVADVASAWNTGNLRVGPYQVFGQLFDAAGRLADEATAPFTIGTGDGPVASLRTTTDRPVYHTTDRVQIGDLVRNLAANASIAGARLDVRVVGAQGNAVYAHSLALGELAPGAVREAPQSFGYAALAEGRYTVVGELHDGSGALLASDDAVFDVAENRALALAGQVLVSADRAERGDALTCTDTVTHRGTQAINGQALRQLLVRLDQDALVAATEAAVDLAPGASRTLPRMIATDPLAAPADYACILQALVGDDWIALGSAAFRLTEPPVRLSGAVAVAADSVERGDVQTCTETVANDGKASLGAQPIRQRLLNAATGAELEAKDSTLALPAGSRQTLPPHTVDTTALESGGYACVLDAQVGGAWQTLARGDFTVTPPKPRLTGTTAVGLAEVPQGDSQTCTDTVTHVGKFGVTDQRLRQILSGDPAGLLSTQEATLDLAAGETHTLVRSFGTAELALGPYTCGLEAYLDNAWTPLSSAPFRVKEPPIRIRAELELGRKGRLLILLDPGADGDPLGPPLPAPSLAQQRAALEALLIREGWSYTIVTDAVTFARELHSGAYDVYALFSEAVKLATDQQKELREAVYRGEGLVEAGSHDQRNSIVDDALGIKFVGKHAKADGVDFLASELSVGGRASYALTDKTLKAIATGAEAQASVVVSGSSVASPVVTSYRFGDGRSVYSGFDLLVHATQAGDASLFGGLLRKAPVAVLPGYAELNAGRVVPLTLTLANEGNATSGQVVLQLPAGSLIEDAGAAEITADDRLTWSYALAEAQTVTLTVWIRLPDASGTVPVEAAVQVALAGGSYADHTTARLDLAAAQPAGLAEALAATGDVAFKLVKKHLDTVQQAIAAGDWNGANGSLLAAADELAKSTDARAPAIRRMVGQALFEAGRQL